MGKPWLLYKFTGSGICHTTCSSPSTTKSTKRGEDRGGCMTTIFHMFHQPSFISHTFINTSQESSTITPKGIEAPINSLELVKQDQVVNHVASSKLNQETNFNIHMGGIQIKTKISEDASSECSSSSPCTKTPNLVARLMGLDLLPEYSSPRSSSSSSYVTPLNHPLSKLSSYKNNARSLPSTPWISRVSRPSTEIDHHHRLSLQIADKSTREYAKQIAKQVRENISRRVGVDITNSVKKREQRRDEHLVVLKPKRPSPQLKATAVGKSRNLDQGYGGKENEPIPLSCSPSLRLLNIENNLNKPNSNLPKSSPLSSCSEVIKAPLSGALKSKSMKKDEVQMVKQENPIKVQKCNKMASEKYDLRLKKVHRKEEPFVKKCKKSTSLLNHLVKVNTTTKFTSLPQKQVPLAMVTRKSHYGLKPIGKSYEKIRCFPATDCPVVGAIAFEAEEVVREIERDVVDTLVDEMAGIIWHVGCRSRV